MVPAVEEGELVFASLDLWATEIESDDPSAPREFGAVGLSKALNITATHGRELKRPF